jgi:hypothetical protein
MPSPADFIPLTPRTTIPSQHMHCEAQHIYTLIKIHSSRKIKDRIFKVGSARFINMNIK